MSKNEFNKTIFKRMASNRNIIVSTSFLILLSFLILTPQLFFPASDKLPENPKVGHLSDHTHPQSECGEVSADRIKELTLVAQPIVWEVAPGKSFSTWAFNGTIPGPTICLNEGDTLILTLQNNLNTIVSFHAHGLERDYESDGTFMSNSFAVPGGSYTYTLYADNLSVGTWAYHDAVAELDEVVIVENLTIPESGEGIERGLFGAIVVYGENENLNVDHEIIIVEAEFEAEVTLGPTYMTFNGRIDPYTPHYIFKLGETIRIRVVNVGPNANHDIIIQGIIWKDTISGTNSSTALFGALEFGDFIIEASQLIDTNYICGIPFHKEWGMIGKFTIVP